MIATASLRAALKIAVVGATALSLAGCFSSPRRTVASLQPAPSVPVQRAELPPPPPPEPTPEAPIAQEPLPDDAALSGGATTGTQVAAASAGGPALNRTDLLGGWTVSSNGETCQLFMSLTTWTGGYRASTRGCSSPSLADISAWDVSGRTVTLKGGEGATPVASLAAGGAQSFSGATTAGAPITVSR